MKRLLLLIASAVFLSILGPLSAYAQVPQGAGTDGKSSRVKVHRHCGNTKSTTAKKLLQSIPFLNRLAGGTTIQAQPEQV